MEWLRITGAPSDVWKQFFRSDLFLSVMRDPDFVFGLEEFLSAHPELSEEARGAIRAAYFLSNVSGRSSIKWYAPCSICWGQARRKNSKKYTFWIN